MRYVITGASGHIGNNLVRLINHTQPNAEVVVLVRRRVTTELNGAVCKQVVGDLNSLEFLQSNIMQGDRVVHCAGLIELSNKNFNKSYESNFCLTKNVCDVCLRAQVKKFVYISSVDAIYKTGKNLPIVEPFEYYPQKLETTYAKTKAMATQYVKLQIDANPSFNAGIILPTAVLGINDFKPSAAGKIIKDTLRGKAQFGIKGGYNFVDVVDVCQAIISLCQSNQRGQFIVSGENVTVKSLYNAINQYKGLKKKPIILPTFVAVTAVPFVKMLNLVMIKVLQQPHDYSCQRAQDLLHYLPTPFLTTLKNCVDWHEKRL